MPIEKIYAFLLEKHMDLEKWLNRDRKEEGTRDIPVLAFLIQHSGGNILYDTGSSARARKPGYLDELFKGNISVDFENTGNIMEYLDAVGVDSLSHLVLSHCHFDHAGWIREIRERYASEVVIHQKELDFMKEPGEQEEVYFQDELECLDDVTGISDLMYDILDGVCTYFLPGHTPGHIGLYLEDDNMVLVGDSVFTDDNLKGCLPDEKMVADASQYRATTDELLSLQGEDNRLIRSHDPRWYSEPEVFQKLFKGHSEFVKKGKLRYLEVKVN